MNETKKKRNSQAKIETNGKNMKLKLKIRKNE